MTLPVGSGVVILGASARAAAFSALRAGLLPWCADLFGDLDLRQRCPGMVVPAQGYPEDFLDLLTEAPAGPLLYTGALENSPRLVDRLGQRRPLWGNAGHTLRQVRSPFLVRAILCRHGLPVPSVRPAACPPGEGRWLLKPWAGGGGTGIRTWTQQPLPRRAAARYCLQEFIEGDSGAALFLGDDNGASLLGVSRQLVGEQWLHAAPFRYCGSVGPLTLSAQTTSTLQDIGQALAHTTGLCGLFGIDFVLRDAVPWPVEVNPRYTASVEVLEYATGLPALGLHRRVFDPEAPVPQPGSGTGVVGKGILYAATTLTFPEDGPWMDTLRRPAPVMEMPAFADIPESGQVIQKGRPILSFLVRAGDEYECLRRLKRIAADLDRWIGSG